MKKLLTLIFLLFIGNLFAQTQKGTLYLKSLDSGFSLRDELNVAFFNATGSERIENISNFSINPSLGIFVRNNTLLTANFGFSQYKEKNIFNLVRYRFLNFGFELTQYFGQGKLKGLASLELAAWRTGLYNKSFSGFFESENRSIQSTGSANLRFGAIYFLTDFMGIELANHLSIVSLNSRFSPNYFRNKLNPDIRLALQWFFQRGQFKNADFSTLNYIKRGVLQIGADGGFQRTRASWFLNMTADVRYFFRDHLYLQVQTHGSTYLPKFDNRVSSYSISGGLELGGYLPLTKKIALLGFGSTDILQSKRNSRGLLPSVITLYSNTNSASLGAGVTLFLDHIKSEVTLARNYTYYSSQNQPIDDENVANFIVEWNTEIFLNRNWSIGALVNYLPNYTTFSSSVSSSRLNFEFNERNKKEVSFSVRFSRYLRL